MRRSVLIFGFEVLKDIMDPSIFESHNRKQVIFHHDDELDQGPSCPSMPGPVVGDATSWLDV